MALEIYLLSYRDFYVLSYRPVGVNQMVIVFLTISHSTSTTHQVYWRLGRLLCQTLREQTIGYHKTGGLSPAGSKGRLLFFLWLGNTHIHPLSHISSIGKGHRGKLLSSCALETEGQEKASDVSTRLLETCLKAKLTSYIALN